MQADRPWYDRELIAAVTCLANTDGGDVYVGVEDDGTVVVASADGEAMNRAIALINRVTAEAEIGKIYKGTVRKVMDFGAFVEILPGTDGLVHISQLGTGGREKDLLAQLLEQRQAGVVLELANLRRHAGLGEVQLFRRTRVAEQPGHGFEDVQLAQRGVFHLAGDFRYVLPIRNANNHFI